ncbi:MAG: M48 family metallopeptidase [Actinomycetota bacterium]
MSTDPTLPGFEPDVIESHAATPSLVPSDVEPQPFAVRVERSAKRKRTVGAVLRHGVLEISVPTWMSRAEEGHWVDKMSASFRRKMSTDRIDLTQRAATLARRHELPHPRHIRWADDMTTRWGSCTYSTGTIRISNRLAAFPDWVIDYIIVHELCHLEVRGHGSDFWKMVNRFPKAERAIGFLIAKSADDDDLDGQVDTTA